jgi:hypothetical protein
MRALSEETGRALAPIWFHPMPVYGPQKPADSKFLLDGELG